MAGTRGDGGLTTASFGYWVRRRRLALDLTQSALARRVGCSAATIKKIEHDERRPSPRMAQRLATSLEVPDDEQDRVVAVAVGKLGVHRLDLRDRPAPQAGALPPWLSSLPRTPRETFVGRETELARLDVQLSAALRGHGRVCFVAGEAGQGKTALLTAFLEHALDAHPALVAARGYGTAASGLGDPYLPFRDVLLMLVGDPQARWQADHLATGQAERVWHAAPTVARLITEHGPQLIDGLVPRLSLEQHLPVAVPDGNGAAAGSRDQLLAQVTAVFESLSQVHPLLLVIDDLQWADAASAELLFHLVRRLDGSRILLVCAYRSSEIAEEDQATPASSVLRRAVLEAQRLSGEAVIDLEEADSASAKALSDALVDRHPNALTATFRSQLFAQTRGHPLFVTELLRELQDRGDLVRDADGRWMEHGDVDWTALPSRVTAVIEQRLSRLDERERSLLETAAVDGEHFTAEVVAAATGIDHPTVYRLLARLEDTHGLVREAGTVDVGGAVLTRCRFSHALFSQYLYESVTAAQRRQLHRALATRLEALHEDDPEPVVARLAHHFSEAHNADRAVAYLLRAGDRARMVYAIDEAARNYERAVAFLRQRRDDERLARTLMKLGLTYQTSFAHEQAQQAFNEAFALWARNDVGTRREAAATLRVAWTIPDTLDPSLGGYDLTRPLTTQLFSGLVTYGEDDEILPDVAERWEISDEGRRYTFHLRPDAVWSDGVPVTAHDFVFTYRRALDPETGTPVAGSLLDAVVGARARRAGDEHADIGITARDDHTLVIDLEHPTAYFMGNLAYYVLLPVPRHAVEAHGAAWATPEHFVGNGPFRLVEWERRRMVLERNLHYHGPSAGNVARVELDLLDDGEDSAQRYLEDELDVIDPWFTPITPDALRQLRQRHPTELHERRGFATYALGFDLDHAPFDDVHVRRAVACGIDRHALADVLGLGSPASGSGLVPPGMPGHVRDGGLVHDPEEAARLLADMPGRDDWPPVTVIGRSPALVAVLADTLRGLGIASRAEVVGSRDPDAVAATNRPWIVARGWIADYPDPDNFLRVWVGLHLPDGWHERYAGILDEAARTPDQPTRLERYREAEEILTEQVVLVPLLYQGRQLLLKPWVRSFPTTGVKHPGFWKDVRIGGAE